MMALRLLVWLGTAPGAIAFWLALALTYLTHSLAWSGAAALLAHRRTSSSARRHLYWKVALVGPLLTALLASVASGGVEHALGHASYVREVSVPPVMTQTPSSSAGPRSSTQSTGRRSSIQAVAPAPASASYAWGEYVAACGFAATGLGLLRFVAEALLLRRRLQGRKKVSDTRLLRRLEALRSRTGLARISLTQSHHIGSPLVIGSAEICIPYALLADLMDPEIDAVLAHELAHLERGDGIWFPIVGLMQSVLWLQPINHWVSASFRQSAELACDDRAVELTRNPLGLARALVQVAAGASLAQRLTMVPAMVRSRSTLLPRVKRLTSAGPSADQSAGGRDSRWAVVALTALGVMLASLSVQVAQARPSTPIGAAAPLRAHAKAVPVALPPDAGDQSARMTELAQREQQLTALLEVAQRRPDAQAEGTPDSIRVLELSQELRHLRANEVWLEQRFVDEWAKWDKDRVGLRRAAH